MRDEDRYLQQRGTHWQYVRRVPVDVEKHYPQKTIRRALRTENLSLARLRRDKNEWADNEYWTFLRMEGQATNAEQRRYEAALSRAAAWHYDYVPSTELARPDNLEELLRRVEDLNTVQPTRGDVEALLGHVTKPDTYLADAFKVVCDEVVAEELARKDEEARKDWKKQRQSTIDLFNELYGTPKLEQITRDMGRKFYNHWKDRVIADPEVGKRITGNHANRQIGNIRKLLDLYHKHLGIDYENPLAGFSFSNKKRDSKEPFSIEQIQTVFLSPGPFQGLHVEARLVAYMMIETGARMAELLRLDPEDLITDDAIPHMKIFERDGRGVKNENSSRIIPLGGISLEAAKIVKARGGFPHYRVKRKSLSSNANKFGRTNKLFGEKQSFYSLRHSFEDRMKEAGVDDEMRRYLMGHEIDREVYGKFGSLKLKQKAIQSILLPFDKSVLEDIS